LKESGSGGVEFVARSVLRSFFVSCARSVVRPTPTLSERRARRFSRAGPGEDENRRRVAESEFCDFLSPFLFPSSRSRARRGRGDGDEGFEQPFSSLTDRRFFEHDARSSASTVSLDHRCSFRRWKATASETRRRARLVFEAQRPRRSTRLGRGRLLDHSPLLMPTRICVNSVLCGLQDAIEAIKFSKDSLFALSRVLTFAEPITGDE
jgi:hypothetical protein